MIRKIPRQCRRAIKEKSKGSIGGECSRYPTASGHFGTETVLKYLKDRENINARLEAGAGNRYKDSDARSRFCYNFHAANPFTANGVPLYAATYADSPREV